MITDVFIRVYAQNHLRLAMVNLALTRWLMDPDVNVQLIVHKDSMGIDTFSDTFKIHIPSKEPFCVESKKIAEALAKSDVYVLADDDQLIIGKDWVERGLGIHENFEGTDSKFAFLAARSICGEVPDASLIGEPSILIYSGQAATHPSNSVGTPYFIRKDLITDFPASDAQGGGSYDTIFSKHCIDKGFKVGFMRDLRFNHLGNSYSACVPNHWGANASRA